MKFHVKQVNPSGHRLLVKPDKVDEVSAGGILLPTSTQDKEQAAATTGEVIEVGEDCWYDKPSKWCARGDKILFARYSGTVVIDQNTAERFVIINDEDVLARIGGNDENSSKH